MEKRKEEAMTLWKLWVSYNLRNHNNVRTELSHSGYSGVSSCGVHSNLEVSVVLRGTVNSTSVPSVEAASGFFFLLHR